MTHQIWMTEGPSWAGDLPAFRSECTACGSVSDELYSEADAREVNCAACREFAKGQANRTYLAGAQRIEAVAVQAA